MQIFVDRVESQLLNAETLNIRTAVDGYYEQISRTMFGALQAMAKMDGGAVDEDKGQLNHHVILIGELRQCALIDTRLARKPYFRTSTCARRTENMHHFTTEVSRQRNPALSPLVKRAESIYLDSLASYVHFVLRRPLGKMLVSVVILSLISEAWHCIVSSGLTTSPSLLA